MIELNLDFDVKLDKPKRYKVILLNDDYSTFDFVVDILMSIFKKSKDEAIALTMKIDQEGSAVVGVYSHEIAETKVMLVKQKARNKGFPLRAIMEEE